MHKEATEVMKLTNILGKANRSFAGVLLALSIFGFFPLQAKQVKRNHRVNLITSEQVTSQDPAGDGAVYEWFY
jgi:hypothetical protein